MFTRIFESMVMAGNGIFKLVSLVVLVAYELVLEQVGLKFMYIKNDAQGTD